MHPRLPVNRLCWVLATRRRDARRWLRGRGRSVPPRRAAKADVLPRPARIWRAPPSRLRESLFSEAFLTSYGFLMTHPYRAFHEAASGANEGSGGVAIGTAAAIVRANLPEPA